MKLEGLNVLLTLDFDTSEFALLIYLKLLLLEFKFRNINKHQSHTRPQIYIYIYICNISCIRTYGNDIKWRNIVWVKFWEKLPIFPDIFGQSTLVKGQSTRAWGGQCGRAIVKLKNAFDFCSEGDLNPKQKA